MGFRFKREDYANNRHEDIKEKMRQAVELAVFEGMTSKKTH